MYNLKNADNVALLWEDFMYQVDNKETSSARKEHMTYPRFTKVIIDHFIFKDNTISMRNIINLYTARDDSLLAYKTYLDYDTGKVPPKKARKFKKPASFKLKTATTAPTTGVVVRDNPGKSVSKKKAPAKTDRGKGIELLFDAALLEDAELKKTLRKSKRETHKLQASGSSEGADFESEVLDEHIGKTKDTSDRTGVKPRVPDVSKEDSSDSDDDSWGNSEDENDDFNDEDDDGSNDDDSGNDDGDGNDAEDSEQAYSNDGENPSFTLKDYEEEKQDGEYVHTSEKEKSNDEEKMYEEEDDDYFASKVKEAVDVAVRLQSNKLKEDSIAENQEFFNQVDSTMKAIIKEQVKAQVSKIMPQIEKYVTESLGAEVLVRSTNQPQLSYTVAASLSEFELKKILIDKMETNKLINKPDIQKNLYNSFIEAYNSDKDIITSYSDVVTLKRGRDDQDKDEDSFVRSDRWAKRRKPKSLGKFTQAEEPNFKAADTKMQQDQGNESGHIDDQPDNEAAPKHDWPAFNLLKGSCRSFAKLEYHFKECYKAVNDRLDWHNLEGHECPFDLSKPLSLIKDRGCQVVPADYFINNDLEYLQGGSSSRKYVTSITITKAPNVKVMRWYDYGYLEEIVVRRDDNVLYKFKEGDFPRLNLRDIEDMLLFLVQKKLSNLDVDDRSVFNDVASNLKMDYLPKRHWSNLKMKRSRIMVKAIDMMLFERRLRHNLEKFVGGRDYGNDLRLLERTI
nr:hypothetical protein [Tanacetum cinerariifolium]GEW64825.1 hypothetical protein [Tanacetum cinerariifolium]